MPEDIHDRILKALLLSPMSAFQLAACLDTPWGSVWDQTASMWRQGLIEETIKGSPWTVVYLLTDDGSKAAIALIQPSLEMRITV